MLHPRSARTGPRALQPTRLHPGAIRLARIDRPALAAFEHTLHPALLGVRRFVDALLTLSPQAARRLGAAHPDVWAATREADGQVIGLGWLAGEATEVIAAPGREHDEVTRRLVDALLGTARARRLTRITARLAGPFHAVTPLRGAQARVMAERDGALFLKLDLTSTSEPDHVAP